jgi:periplasmic protein TonB
LKLQSVQKIVYGIILIPYLITKLITMETNKILNAHILDIIFDGKNKTYGAYELRKSYSKRLVKALLLTAAFALLLFFSSVFANFIGKNRIATIEVTDTEMAQLKVEPPAPVVPPPPVTPPPIVEINQVKFTPPVIVKDDEVKPEDEIKELEPDAAISNKTIETDNTDQIVAAPIEEKGTGVIETLKKEDEEDKILTIVQVEAAYDGDWNNFVKRNLNAELPAENGAPAGKYTVIVKFVVSKDGSVSDIDCENDPGYGICEEAKRVIKKTKNWVPAIQNGRNVNAYRRQHITFLVEE